MRLSFVPALILSLFVFVKGNQETCERLPPPPTAAPFPPPTDGPQCTAFTIAAGTGCAWMCNYCANELGTNNYYFVDGVCKYQEGVGCVGNPQTNYIYTCCRAST